MIAGSVLRVTSALKGRHTTLPATLATTALKDLRSRLLVRPARTAQHSAATTQHVLRDTTAPRLEPTFMPSVATEPTAAKVRTRRRTVQAASSAQVLLLTGTKPPVASLAALVNTQTLILNLASHVTQATFASPALLPQDPPDQNKTERFAIQDSTA